MDGVPETFIDAFGEISLKHGMIRIELLSLSGPEPRVTQRLIMNLQAFSQMVQVRSTSAPPAADPTPERGGVVAAVRRLARMEPVPQPAEPPAGPPAAATALGPPKSPNFSED